MGRARGPGRARADSLPFNVLGALSPPRVTSIPGYHAEQLTGPHQLLSSPSKELSVAGALQYSFACILSMKSVQENPSSDALRNSVTHC